MFHESDLEWLQVIGCMKKAGMSIRRALKRIGIPAPMDV